MVKAIVFSITIFALAACGGDHHTDLEASALQQGTTRGQALQAQAAQEFTGSTETAAIAMAAGIVFAINNGEIAQANFVLSKTATVSVRSLASQIVADHQASNAMLQALLQSRNLSPVDTSVSQTLTSEASAGLAQLQADELRNLDIDYTRMQIAMHQEASMIVSTVRDAMPASATDMRNFLSDTLTTIDAHLAHAEDVLSNLP